MNTKSNSKDQAAHAPRHANAGAEAEELPLNVVCAQDMSGAYTPIDELVQGLLTVGGSSMVYGDSNSGKTFLAIDIATAVARGIDWMGRHVEQGMVLYLAAESPESVRSRVQAYQKHHGIVMPHFFIVQNSINLFADDKDTDAIIKTVKMLEAKHRQRVRLIVGDTLARLSAGANENTGQDMGQVVARIDRIRSLCGAHFMLIHHSGKNVAAGARGWTGTRAAVDVEVEVTDLKEVRCAEVTKNRDLGSKGERMGFKLDVVELGLTKWGRVATTCVVAPAAAPVRRERKKSDTIESKILTYLAEQNGGTKKENVVAHLAGKHQSATVYRAMRGLMEKGQLQEVDGLVSIVGRAM